MPFLTTEDPRRPRRRPRAAFSFCLRRNTELTLSHDAGQRGLELLLGLLHLLLVLNLLAGQPADVAVGRLDHGVEVVGVPPVDLAPLQPRQENAHGLGELAVVWGRGARGRWTVTA